MNTKCMLDSNTSGFDIIGDVHGCLPELVRLLTKLGYQRKRGCYQHPHRKAVFVGDVIDRGKYVRQTLAVIKAMVEAKTAHMVLGNHELNWLNSSVYLPSKGDYLRRRTQRNMQHQHATWQAFANHDTERQTTLAWLRTLPLWLDLGEVRVAHAGWSEDLRADWTNRYGAASELDDDMLGAIVRTGTMEQRTIQAFTCGSTIPLPDGYQHLFHDGQLRSQMRAKFWPLTECSYGALIFPPDVLPHTVAQQSIAPHLLARIHRYDAKQTPLLVGHYSLLPEKPPVLLATNVACVDYTCFTYKKLFCYQYNHGDVVLTNDRFVSNK